jgi:ubiquinone biosynthesis accessory factor UbiJ
MDLGAFSQQQLVALGDRLLKLDPGAGALLRPLAGRVLAVEIDGFEQPLRVRFSEEGLGLAEAQAPADASVRGTPAALLSLAARRGAGNTGAVEFRGDVAVVHGVRKLLGSLEIDWEEQLSRLTGDVLAHQLGNLVRGGLDWLGRSRRTLEQNLGEYLTEEGRQLPAEAEVGAFLNDVDRLRQDVDRLQARIELLEKRRGDA